MKHGVVFRVVTYLPRKFSRGDSRILERRGSGFTAISVTKETRAALETMCRNFEAEAAEAEPEQEFRRVSVEYLLAMLTLGAQQVWPHKEVLPDDFTRDYVATNSSGDPAAPTARPVSRGKAGRGSTRRANHKPAT